MKIISEIRVSQSGVIVPISPLDSRRYLRLGICCASFIPLRQLAFLQAQEEPPSILSDYFVVAGSSFDIRHNRRNLEFIINKVAPILLSLEPKIKIRVFGTRIPSDLKPPNNVEILGFREDYQNQLINSLGAVVPFHGGAGMQSKVFEPLTMGVPLIANPKSLVGFPYEQGVHFMAVRTAEEYVVAMLSLFSNMNLRQELSSNARERSNELFGDDKILNKIEWVISDQQNI
jgi:glycosyltransferase involved in cell wall biosynthesis